MQLISTVTSKGQILIPVSIRNKLNIKPNDRVIFDVSGVKIVAQKAPSTDQMYGFIKTKNRLSDNQLEEAINKATKKCASEK